jgi:hypothetical protein
VRSRLGHELAAAYHERWEEETGNDQHKTHLGGLPKNRHLSSHGGNWVIDMLCMI